MDTMIFTIATLVGLAISVLVMSVLFAITFGELNAFVYTIIGIIIGFITGLSVYGLLNKIK